MPGSGRQGEQGCLVLVPGLEDGQPRRRCGEIEILEVLVVAGLDSAGIRVLTRRLSDRSAGADLALPVLTVPLPRLFQDARR